MAPAAPNPDATQPTNTVQQSASLERVASVGPWQLRRASASDWTAISSPGLRTRRSTVSSEVISPGTGVGATSSTSGNNGNSGNNNNNSSSSSSSSNPFSDAFAASLIVNVTPFRERNTSEASSSTAVASSADIADATLTVEKSEFTKTIEEIDRQCDEIGHIVDGEAIAASNDDAERRRYDLSRRPRRELRWADVVEPIRQQLDSLAARLPSTGNLDREAAGALHNLEEAATCQACDRHRRIAVGGMWVIALTLLMFAMMPFLFVNYLHEEYDAMSQKLDENNNAMPYIVMMGIPFSGLLATSVACWLLMISLRSSNRRLRNRTQFLGIWLACMVGSLGMYFLIAILKHKYGK